MYILFRCLNCGRLIAWPDNKSDGNRCVCDGHLIPLDKGEREELREKYFVQGNIDFNPRRVAFAITDREHDEIIYNLLSERFAELKTNPNTWDEKKYRQIGYLLELYQGKNTQHNLKR